MKFSKITSFLTALAILFSASAYTVKPASAIGSGFELGNYFTVIDNEINFNNSVKGMIDNQCIYCSKINENDDILMSLQGNHRFNCEWDCSNYCGFENGNLFGYSYNGRFGVALSGLNDISADYSINLYPDDNLSWFSYITYTDRYTMIEIIEGWSGDIISEYGNAERIGSYNVSEDQAYDVYEEKVAGISIYTIISRTNHYTEGKTCENTVNISQHIRNLENLNIVRSDIVCTYFSVNAKEGSGRAEILNNSFSTKNDNNMYGYEPRVIANVNSEKKKDYYEEQKRGDYLYKYLYKNTHYSNMISMIYGKNNSFDYTWDTDSFSLVSGGIDTHRQLNFENYDELSVDFEAEYRPQSGSSLYGIECLLNDFETGTPYSIKIVEDMENYTDKNYNGEILSADGTDYELHNEKYFVEDAMYNSYILIPCDLTDSKDEKAEGTTAVTEQTVNEPEVTDVPDKNVPDVSETDTFSEEALTTAEAVTSDEQEAQTTEAFNDDIFNFETVSQNPDNCTVRTKSDKKDILNILRAMKEYLAKKNNNASTDLRLMSLDLFVESGDPSAKESESIGSIHVSKNDVVIDRSSYYDINNDETLNIADLILLKSITSGDTEAEGKNIKFTEHSRSEKQWDIEELENYLFGMKFI